MKINNVIYTRNQRPSIGNATPKRCPTNACPKHRCLNNSTISEFHDANDDNAPQNSTRNNNIKSDDIDVEVSLTLNSDEITCNVKIRLSFLS